MDWLAIQSFLRNWFATAIGMPVANVAWADQNRERDTYPYATLNILVDGGLGIDELVYVYDEPTDNFVEHVQGIREFTVSLKVETNSQHPTANARYFLSKARANIRHSATLDDFSAAGLAIVQLMDANQFDIVHGLGMTSVGVMDLRLAVMIDDYDATKPTSYIKTTEIEGKVNAPPQISFGPDTYGDTED